MTTNKYLDPMPSSMLASILKGRVTMGYVLYMIATMFNLDTVTPMTLSHSQSDRRGFLSEGTKIPFLCLAITTPQRSNALPISMDEERPEPILPSINDMSNGESTVTVPLIFTGQELIVSYQVDGDTFRAGSPFLMIPGSCGKNTREKSGCYKRQGRPTGLDNTIEIFDNFEGEVEWRQGSFSFANIMSDSSRNYPPLPPRESPIPLDPVMELTMVSPSYTPPSLMFGAKSSSPNNVVFGVASENIMSGPGGVFFGIIRDTDKRIRPSFLGQTNVASFQVDLKSRPRTLALSTTSIVTAPVTSSSSNSITEVEDTNSLRYIPLSNLLRKKYGDPVQHYAVRATSIDVNSHRLASDDGIRGSRPIVVIIDTGVTGMIVSRDLFDEQYDNARRRKDKNLFGTVSLLFDTNPLSSSVVSSQHQQEDRKDQEDEEEDAVVTLSAVKPLCTPFDPEYQWKKFDRRNRILQPPPPHIIILGLAFLENHTITIDIDEQRLWVA